MPRCKGIYLRQRKGGAQPRARPGMAIEKHYTGRQVAELLALDYETVLHKAQTGEIASVRVGRLRRFRESDVQAWLDRQHDNDVVVALTSRIGSPIKETL